MVLCLFLLALAEKFERIVGRTDALLGQCVVFASRLRSRLQRRKPAANLITPVGWAFSPVSGERFWRSLPFGGAGFALAWLLAQL